MKISVVIPCYNRQETIGLAVHSAMTQSYAPAEVIVIDDGSNPPLSRHLLLDDSRLKIIRLEQNNGAANARQVGVEAASGDVIALLDSDDFWFPTKLEKQVLRLQSLSWNTSPIAVSCGWRTKPESGAAPKEYIPRGSRGALDFAAGCWFAPGSTLMIPRWVLEVVGPFNPKLRRLEDYEWFLRFAIAGGCLVVEPEVGATVSIGRRGQLEPVNQAKRLIEESLSMVEHPLLDQRFRHVATAYLHLEVAKAAQNQRQYVLMLRHLLQSFIMKPRLRVPLEQWWTIKRPLLYHNSCRDAAHLSQDF